MIHFKEYNYKSYRCYYLTINGQQFGSVMFSMSEVEQAMNKAIKKHMEPFHKKQDELLLKALMEKEIKIKVTEEKDNGQSET